MKSHYRHGFTLIELLVVISIISLLSSVILASLNGARGKASLTAVEQYQASLNHSIGDQLVGEWTFDNTADPRVDTSGNGNNLQNSGFTWLPNGGYNGNGAYSSNGASAFMQIISPSSVLNFTTNDFTVGFWVKTASTDTMNQYKITRHWLGTGYEVDIGTGAGANNKFLTFYLQDPSHTDLNVILSNTNLRDMNWHYVVAVFNRSSSVVGYVDGIKGLSSDISNAQGSIANNGNYFIGYNAGSDTSLNGTLDDLRIYSSALSAMSVEKLYAEGKATHRNLADR